MLEGLLEDISNNPGIHSCGIFDQNGLLICSKGSRNNLETMVSTMQSLIDNNKNSFHSLNIDPINCITLIGETGTSLFWPLKDSAALGILIQAETNLGEIRRIVTPLLQRIETLI
jgi:predicted regulator of Ras-like GTPase activity (Roadblock/LC7/MglB family)